MDRLVIDVGRLDALIGALRNRGYTTIGPTVRDRSIVLDEIAGTDDLPGGWRSVQDGGTYRLERRGDDALFGHVHGHDSWKKFLHPARIRLWRAERRGRGFAMTDGPEAPPAFAFVGVRACDLAAIRIQDRVLRESEWPDRVYVERRDGAFVVAANCGEAGGTCFCVSMGSGPAAGPGHDLALTEVLDDGGHRFVVDVGSERGADVIADLDHRPVTATDSAAAAAAVEHARQGMGRTMRTQGLKALLQDNAESPQWQEVAERCLTCGNCTMVCPTCFCTTVEDTSDLTGEAAERWRLWDSCFTFGFSYINGGVVRESPEARYRQWITHKLASWHDQFGTSGCVGCGRCITWCPVGIDITEEVAGLRRRTGEEVTES